MQIDKHMQGSFSSSNHDWWNKIHALEQLNHR